MKITSLTTFKIIITVCDELCVGTFMLWYMCGDDGTILWSWFSASAFLLALGLELRSPGLCRKH